MAVGVGARVAVGAIVAVGVGNGVAVGVGLGAVEVGVVWRVGSGVAVAPAPPHETRSKAQVDRPANHTRRENVSICAQWGLRRV